jgi:hypothetical protein
MKKIFLIIIILFPLLLFPQRKIEDFFNNRIDFVLDNNYGRAFMGGIVEEYIINDSLNNTYNRIGIQPFYKYSQSNFFDKNLLKENESISANKEKTEFNFGNYVDSKTYDEYTLNINSFGDFNIKSRMEYNTSGQKQKRTSYYETFKNFELSFYTKKKNVNEILSKNFYSNVNIVVNGISVFEKESISDISFFNTLSIKFNNSDKCITFFIKIYETIGVDRSYREGNVDYLGYYPNIIMRKIEITGNEGEAIKYLKKNKLDYTVIAPQDYNEENFKKKNN